MSLSKVVKLITKNKSKSIKPKTTDNNIISAVPKITDKVKKDKELKSIENMVDFEINKAVRKQKENISIVDKLKETGKYPDFKIGEKLYFPNSKETRTIKSLSYETAFKDDKDVKDLIKIGSTYYRPLIILDNDMPVNLNYLKDLKVIKVVKNKGGLLVERNPYNYEPKAI